MDDLIIVQGGPHQLYTIFLSKETLLVSLVMIPDIVRSWSWTIPMDELETKQISQYPISCPFVQRVVQDKDVIFSSFTRVFASYVS